MDEIEKELGLWQANLVNRIPLAGLLARNPVAYKWKAAFRCWMLREVVFWRITDLLTQSCVLYQQGHVLGARILLRSAFETLATLIYLNLLIQRVVDGQLDFHEFSKKTSTLLLGSRDNSTTIKSLNIMTILEKCEGRYPELSRLYSILSECAHPSYSGMVEGYSSIDYDEHETHFASRWTELYGGQQPRFMNACMEAFRFEYDEVWIKNMEALESWIGENDQNLEATKDDAP